MKCRLCAMKTDTDKYKPLAKEELSRILALIDKHLLLKLAEADDLYICQNCCHLLNQFNIFYQMAHENQKHLEETKIDTNEKELKQNDMPVTSNFDTFEIEEFLEEPKGSEAAVEIVSQTESQILLNIKYEMDQDDEEFKLTTNADAQQLKEELLSEDDDDDGDDTDDDDDDDDEDTDEKTKKENEDKQKLTQEELDLEKMVEEQIQPRVRRAKKRSSKEHRQIDEIIAKNIELKCYRCEDNVTFKLFNDLKAHYRKNHKGTEGYVTCCNRNIYNRPELMDHIKSHTDPDMFKCTVCDKKFQSKKYMDIHMSTAHLSGDCSKYKCTVCNKGFPWASALRSHLDCHKTEKSYVCDNCGASFAGYRRLRAHLKYVHNNVNQNTNYECNLCKRSIKLKGSVWRHMIRQHQVVSLDNPTHCGICSIDFESQPLCKAHMVEKHVTVGGSISQCYICNKTFKSGESVKSHIIEMHVQKGAIAHFV